jgi:hypothetical protein
MLSTTRQIIAAYAVLLATGLPVPVAAARSVQASRVERVAECCVGQSVVRIRTVQMSRGYNELRDVRVEGDRLVGRVGGGEAVVPIEDISEIRIRQGSRVREGLGIGLLAGVTAVVMQELYACDGGGCDGVPKAALYGGFLAGATFAGGVVGALLPRWSTAYAWRIEARVQARTGHRAVAILFPAR